MTVSEALILYTRPGCHLCDQAAAMLDELGFDWQPVNIDNDPDLVQQYGLQIPVVCSGRAKKKLLYPFGKEQLSRFMEEIVQESV